MASANAIPFTTSGQWTGAIESSSTSHLHQKIHAQEASFESQLLITKQFIQMQARQLADALMTGGTQLAFQLPEGVTCRLCDDYSFEHVKVPQGARRQSVGNWISSIQHKELSSLLSEKLRNLENHSDPAISTAAQLIRYSLAHHLVYDSLPDGLPVSYRTIEGEDIPSIPGDEIQRGVYSQRFFQPQWVSFDEQGHLLTNSILAAEEHMAAMQRYLKTLQMAAVIDPFIVADCEYQNKRYGILGQIVNQGRALGRYWTCEIIAIIHQKLEANRLNRGLSLSMPYFDERDLSMKMYDFEVIPTGRMEFVPAYVVLAVRREQEKVFRNPQFSFGTRKYLLIQLDILEQAFQSDNPLSVKVTAEQA